MSHSIADAPVRRGEGIDSFADLLLQPETMYALSGMGIIDPTPIQSLALPVLLDGRDLIGQARTGSGKTLAFAIPAIELIDPTRPEVQVLVLTPTRELAVQIGGVFDQLSEGRGVRSALIFGGRAVGPQIAALRRAQLVVGTPGRVLDLLNRGALRLERLRFLVLDEADEMLDRGFAPDVERILSRTPGDRQTALFSATIPSWVGKTAERYLRRPVTVAVDPGPADRPPINHVAYDLPDGDKLVALRDLLDQRASGSTIVFGRTKHGVKKLARKLEQDGYPVGALQGNLSQNARDRVMQQFRDGDLQILVATNVAARGLDISTVDQVINLDLPESPELLTHRIGRTGRMGRAGQAITLLAPQDESKWRELQQALGQPIPRLPWRGAVAAHNGDGLSRPTPHRTDRSPAIPNLDQPTGQRAGNHNLPAQAPRFTVRRSDGRPLGSMQPRPSSRTTRSTSIVCSTCGTHAEVPFQPDPTRPVYCSNCHRARSTRYRRPRTQS